MNNNYVENRPTCPNCGHTNGTHSSAGCLWTVANLSCHCPTTRDTLEGAKTA